MTERSVEESASSGAALARFYASTIGKKVVMAVTGIVLVGYLVVHMVGNLLIHRGPEAIDEYGRMLKSNLVLLWGVRVTLLMSVILHVHAAVTLAGRARMARPVRYARLERQVSTWSARLIRLGGLILFAFVVFHILHFTSGAVLPSRFAEGAIYQNVARSFSVGWVVVVYSVAMVSLGFHLHHGVESLFQTLGVNHPRFDQVRHQLAWLLAIAIPVGFLSVPAAVVLGWVR